MCTAISGSSFALPQPSSGTVPPSVDLCGREQIAHERLVRAELGHRGRHAHAELPAQRRLAGLDAPAALGQLREHPALDPRVPCHGGDSATARARPGAPGDVEEADRDLAEADLVAVGEDGLADAVAVDDDAVEAAVVEHHHDLAARGHDGVAAGDGEVLEHHVGGWERPRCSGRAPISMTTISSPSSTAR